MPSCGLLGKSVVAIGAVLGYAVRTIKLATGNAVLTVWVAETPAERERGVRGLSGLLPGTGMLLLFEDYGLRMLTMRGVSFPLDMIWLDAGLRVTRIVHSVPPENPINQGGYGTSVLELGAGQAHTLGLTVGSKLRVVQEERVS